MGDSRIPKFTLVVQNLQDNDPPLFKPRELQVVLTYGKDYEFFVRHIGNGLYEMEKVLILSMINNSANIGIEIWNDNKRLAHRTINFHEYLNGELCSIQTDVGKFTVSILFQYSPSITDEKPNSSIEYTVK